MGRYFAWGSLSGHAQSMAKSWKDDFAMSLHWLRKARKEYACQCKLFNHRSKALSLRKHTTEK